MWDLSSPRPGIEPVPPELEAWSLNHWTTREVPVFEGLCSVYLIIQFAKGLFELLEDGN